MISGDAVTIWLQRCILSFLMVSSTLGLAHADSKPAFFADFGYAEDANRDGWPDLWRRYTIRNYPRFNKIGIASRAEIAPEELLKIRRSLAQWVLAWEQGKLPGDIIPESIPRPIDALLESTIADTCLQIVMNGGAARVEGPSFPVDPQNAYRIQMQMKTEIIDPYLVQSSIIWLDEQGMQTGEQLLTPISKTNDWQIIGLHEIIGIPTHTRYAKVRIEVTPEESQSIRAIVQCDRIRFEGIARLELSIVPDSRIVLTGEEVEVICKLNEIDPSVTSIRLIARDHNGEVAWKESRELKTNVNNPADTMVISWRFSLPETGFYTLTAKVIADDVQQSDKQITMVAMPHETRKKRLANSRIGWSLPGIGTSLSLSKVPALLEFAHVGGVKFSVWLSEQNLSNNRSLSWMVENLSTQGIQCIGVIDPPSATLQAQFPEKNGQKLGTLLDFPDIWKPMFDPVWRRTSLFLTQFQIGWDQDHSLERHSQWQVNLTALAKHLRTVGTEANLTLPWNALSEPPDKGIKNSLTVWNRVHHVADPPFTDVEITAFSQQSSTTPKHQWISIDPLDRNRFSIEDRVRDMTQRLIAIHQNEWEKAWISNPSDPNLAILDQLGGPDELLMPLERLSLALNESQDFKPIRFSDYLSGILFRVADEERMILIANKPMEVRLFLGNDWTATDVWGRNIPIETHIENNIPSRILSFGKWPVILSKVDRMLALWQLDVQIENPTIENRIGISEPLRVRLQNPESIGISGTAEVIAPLLLQEESSSAKFDAPAKSTCTFEIPMKLRYDASQSQEPLDMVISLNGKTPRQFIVQRQVNIGLKDFQLETQTQIDERGFLIINVELLNQSEQIANFECTLVLPNRPREKFQMIQVQERLNRTKIIANGAELRGQTLLLRCEEISSGRVLNHRIEIK